LTAAGTFLSSSSSSSSSGLPSAVDSPQDSEETTTELAVESLNIGILDFRGGGESLSVAAAAAAASSSSSPLHQCENGASCAGLQQSEEDEEERRNLMVPNDGVESEELAALLPLDEPEPGFPETAGGSRELLEQEEVELKQQEQVGISSLADSSSRNPFGTSAASTESHPETHESNLSDSEVSAQNATESTAIKQNQNLNDDDDDAVPQLINGHSIALEKTATEEKEENNNTGDDDDDEFYVPVNSHRVLGIVVSGDEEGLQIDIGAENLGHLPVKEIQPIDKTDLNKLVWRRISENNHNDDNNHDSSSSSSSSNEQQQEEAAAATEDFPMPKGSSRIVYDEEVLNSSDLPEPLFVDIGTVLNLEVTGTTPNGIALLSARRAARRIAWERIRQIKHCNEPFEIVILESLAAGVVTRIEGLRAFLPRVEFLKHPAPEPNEDLVGTKVWVLITVAEESRGNIILSEVRAWAQRHLCIGTVHDGTVVQIFNFGARVKISGTDLSGLVHISNIARARVPSVATVFEVGEQVKVMAIKSPSPTKYAFSTADLESESGLMLRDKQRVFREAEEVAKKFRDLNPAHVESLSQGNMDDAAVAAASSVKPVKPISNWEWLDFGDTSTGAGVL